MADTRCSVLEPRHQFITDRVTNVRTPACQRCGAPNPRPLTADEVQAYEAWRQRALTRTTSR